MELITQYLDSTEKLSLTSIEHMKHFLNGLHENIKMQFNKMGELKIEIDNYYMKNNIMERISKDITLLENRVD